MKTIAFITRVHPDRPNMLKVCTDSVKAQTSDDYIHILHQDDNTEGGYGVPLANQSLAKIRPIDARYVMILDDDDMLIDSDFVKIFAKITQKGIPEIVFFRGIINGLGIFPRDRIWRKAPRCSLIASFCFAVRQDVWMKHVHKFERKVAGDFSFISHCYKKTRKHHWLNRTVAQTQKRPGRGRGERHHA